MVVGVEPIAYQETIVEKLSIFKPLVIGGLVKEKKEVKKASEKVAKSEPKTKPQAVKNVTMAKKSKASPEVKKAKTEPKKVKKSAPPKGCENGCC